MNVWAKPNPGMVTIGELKPVAPRAGFEDHVAGRVERAVGPVEERLLDPGGGIARATAERRAPHAYGVDLVDEDDALAAPLARELLGLAGEPADDNRVHAQEGLLETGARHQDKRAVEARSDRLGEHRLSGSGRAEEQQTALSLSPGLLERLSGLPEGDDPADLLLGFFLAAHVGQADPPVRVSGLEASHLRDPDQHHRADEDQGVEEEEDRQAEEQSDQLLALDEILDRVVDRCGAVDPTRRPSRDEKPGHPDHGERDEHEDQQPEHGPPERDAAARDDVLFLQLGVVGAVQARPRHHAPNRKLDRAAERGDDAEGRGERPGDAVALDGVEPDERRRAHDEGDRGRPPGQAAPVLTQLGRGGRTVEEPGLRSVCRHA